MKSLKQITPEEAKAQGFLPLEEDYLNSSIEDAKYFSLTPHPDPTRRQEGWEKVTYYLKRRKFNHETSEIGTEYIYVLSNPGLPGLLKIGYTYRNPELRKKEIDEGTGVPIPFSIEYVKTCSKGQLLEKAIHNYLDEYRVNNRREFFQISLEKAIETIDVLYEKTHAPSPTYI